MTTPLVTIYIPTYNRKELLIPCIESALAQTFTDFELVIVDNASTDGAWEVCQEYAEQDSRVMIFRNETNLSAGFNGLRCLMESRGHFVKVLFSDDLITPDFLEKTLPLIENDPDVGFVFTGAEIGREPGQGITKYIIGDEPHKFSSQDFIYYSLFRQGQIVPNSPGAGLFRLADVRQNVLMKIPSPSMDDYHIHGMGVDILLYLITAHKYPLVAHVPEVLAFFRAHDDSETIYSIAKRPEKWIFGYQQAKIWFTSNYNYPHILQCLLMQEWIRHHYVYQTPKSLKEIAALFLHQSLEIPKLAQDSNQSMSDFRYARKQLALFWLNTPPHILESICSYDNFLIGCHNLIMNSGIKSQPLTEEESNFINELTTGVNQGLTNPKAINYLLAAMLYCYPEQLDLPYKKHEELGWFAEDYRKFISAPTIIIDGVLFQLYKTEMTKIWQNIIKQWAKTEFANQILILDRANTVPKIEGMRYRTIIAYDYNNTDGDRLMLQHICDEEGAKLFISTYYTTPVTTPSVFVAYDMIPETLGADINQPMWREKHRGIQHASGYITISENTAHDLVKFFPDISPKSVTVAHCGVNSIFSPATETEINNFKYKYGINKPYFLLDSLGGHKNSILFFKGFSQLTNKEDFDIIASGVNNQLPPEWRKFTAGCTFHSLDLSDEELRLAYAGAVALVYPSLYEGFGMPVAEAIACGCPVITTSNASLPEVGGEAVIYVNADDIEGMANALCDVQKPSLRHNLIAAGLEQAKKFSWSKMADIVSNALISQTLPSFNLREINIIIFPDWTQSEDDLCLQLGEIIQTLAIHPDASQTTLLIYVSDTEPENADLILSSIAMNLMMEAEIDITENLEISLMTDISETQWQTLLPRLQGRIVLEPENQAAIVKFNAEELPTIVI